jgi:hypothetical protein
MVPRIHIFSKQRDPLWLHALGLNVDSTKDVVNGFQINYIRASFPNELRALAHEQANFQY